MHLTFLPGNTGEFQKSQFFLKKCNISKMHKNPIISKISIVWCFFKSDRPVYNHLNVNFIKTALKTIFFSLQRSIFAFLTQKTLKYNKKGSKTLLNVCPLKSTYIGKNRFNFISVWSEMSLKSDD